MQECAARNLSQLLQHLKRLPHQSNRITLAQVLESLGQRSFAPLILVAGLILFSPLSGIPGMPTLMGLLVLLASLQMLLLRRHLWLPEWLLRRSISRSKFHRVLKWLQRPAAFIDRWLQPRLLVVVSRYGAYLIAIVCTAIALALPLMEIVPFSASMAGLAFTAFGLALISQDGALALLAFVLTGAAPALAIYAWL